MVDSPVDGSVVLRAGFRWRFVGLAGVVVPVAAMFSDSTFIFTSSPFSVVLMSTSLLMLRAAREVVAFGTDTVVVRFRFRADEVDEGVVSGITSSISGLGECDFPAPAPVYANRASDDRVIRRGGEAASCAMTLRIVVVFSARVDGISLTEAQTLTLCQRRNLGPVEERGLLLFCKLICLLQAAEPCPNP